MDYSNDPGRWSLKDLKTMLDDGEGPLFDLLTKIADTLEAEHNPNFILGKVIIENDLEVEEEEADDE